MTVDGIGVLRYVFEMARNTRPNSSTETPPSPGSDEAHAQLVKDCLEEFALMGFAAWENQRRAVQVNGRWVSLSKSGRGDIHVILPRQLEGTLLGVHGEVECKTGQSSQAPKQRAHMRMVRSSGGIYILARSKEGLREDLERLGFVSRLQTA